MFDSFEKICKNCEFASLDSLESYKLSCYDVSIFRLLTLGGRPTNQNNTCKNFVMKKELDELLKAQKSMTR